MSINSPFNERNPVTEPHPWARKSLEESLAVLNEKIAQDEKRKAELIQELGNLSALHFRIRAEKEREFQLVLNSLDSHKDQRKKTYEALGIESPDTQNPLLH